MLNKTFLPFFLVAGMFLTMIAVIIHVYSYQPDGELSKEAAVEINLPVIQLSQYLNLSKSLE